MDARRKSTYTTQYKILTDLLVSTRREAGLTQAEVTFALHKRQSYVSKIESGERRIDLVELLHLLKVLKTEKCDLLRRL